MKSTWGLTMDIKWDSDAAHAALDPCGYAIKQKDKKLKQLTAENERLRVLVEKRGLPIDVFNDCERLTEENERLREIISIHNESVKASCYWMQENRGCSDYTIRGRRCPECPQDWLIEIDEEMKDE